MTHFSKGLCFSNTLNLQRHIPMQLIMKVVNISSLLRIRPIGLFQFRITSEIMNRHMVGLLGRVISSSQRLYLHRTTQRRQTRTNIHALSGIQTRDPVYERSRPAPQTVQPLGQQVLNINKNNSKYTESDSFIKTQWQLNLMTISRIKRKMWE
jgi:hypothetical protein